MVIGDYKYGAMCLTVRNVARRGLSVYGRVIALHCGGNLLNRLTCKGTPKLNTIGRGGGSFRLSAGVAPWELRDKCTQAPEKPPIFYSQFQRPFAGRCVKENGAFMVVGRLEDVNCEEMKPCVGLTHSAPAWTHYLTGKPTVHYGGTILQHTTHKGLNTIVLQPFVRTLHAIFRPISVIGGWDTEVNNG